LFGAVNNKTVHNTSNLFSAIGVRGFGIEINVHASTACGGANAQLFFAKSSRIIHIEQ
jgi:hypothetical protein